jgi:hypothetical protein
MIAVSNGPLLLCFSHFDNFYLSVVQVGCMSFKQNVVLLGLLQLQPGEQVGAVPSINTEPRFFRKCRPSD